MVVQAGRVVTAWPCSWAPLAVPVEVVPVERVAEVPVAGAVEAGRGAALPADAPVKLVKPASGTIPGPQPTLASSKVRKPWKDCGA